MSIKYTFLKAKTSKRRYIPLKVSLNCEELNTILNISTRDKDNEIDGESIVSLTIPKTIIMEGTEKINIDIIAPRFLEGFGLNINYIEFEEGITLSQEAFCDSCVINTVSLPKGITSIPDKCFFSSTLSKLQNTKERLALGERVVEVLKQDRNSPIAVENQVIIIYAVTHNYLKDVPVEKIGEFQTELFDYIDNGHPEIIDSIRDTKDLTSDNEEALKSALEEFVKKFTAAL